MVATDELLFISGAGFAAFAPAGGSYAEVWHTSDSTGFSFRLVTAGDYVYSVSRADMVSISIPEPHRVEPFAVSDNRAIRLYDAAALDGFLYIASNQGLIRYSLEDETYALVHPGTMRAVAVGACPPPPSTFPGDADCDMTLTGGDADATLAALFDPRAAATCDADCNRDGEVSGADLTCTAHELAGPVIVRPTWTPFPTRTPVPPTRTRTRTWTPGPCLTNLDCPPEGYCEKPPEHCDDAGTCVERPGACVGFDPVCGCDGRNYEAPCYAAVVGVNVDYYGRCRE
jgi:hypothetical protein